MTIIVLFLLGSRLSASGQARASGLLSGTVVDTKGVGLEGATISVMDQKTGLFLRHAVSDGKGMFSLGKLPLDRPVEMITSYSGYLDSSAVYTLTDSIPRRDIGKWVMRVVTKDLEEVIVTRRKPPFIVKKDTLEFDARQFKTLPTDVVKDLLRKMPGMEVDGAGNVTVNGKKVDKIKVDGREFFNGNLSVALENLPGAIIDKVQVTDTREPEDENTSVVRKKGENLTLNLTLRKENKTGFLGNVEAGYGTQQRYRGNSFLSLLRGDTKLSIMAGASNLSGIASGYAPLEIGERGGMNGFLNGAGVPGNALGVGVMYNTRPGKKTRLDINYMGDRNPGRNDVRVERQNILPDSSFFFNSRSTSDVIPVHHSMGMGLEVDIDSLQHFRFIPQIIIDNTRTRNTDISYASTVDGQPINRQDNRTVQTNNNLMYNQHIGYTRFSRDRASVLTLTWRPSLTRTKGDLLHQSTSLFYKGQDSTQALLDQHAVTSGDRLGSSAEASFKRQLTPKVAAILKYEYNVSRDNQDKDVYNFNSATGKYDLRDTMFSTHYRNTVYGHTPAVALGYTGGKLMAEVSAGMLFQERKSIQPDKNWELRIRQQNISPNVNISYQWSKLFTQTVLYSMNAMQPGAEQLAPAPDNTDPLVVRLGNPALKTGINHQLQSDFSYNNPNLNLMVGCYLFGSMQQHAIAQDNYFDSAGRQIISFRNVEGNKTFNAKLNISKTIIFGKLRFTLMSENLVRNDAQNAFINRLANTSSQWTWEERLLLGLSNDWLQIYAVGGMSANWTTYSLPGIASTDYKTFNGTGSVEVRPFQRLQLKSSVVYNYNTIIPAGFQRSTTVWNASINYTMLKSQRLTIYCVVNDLLNNDNGMRREVSPTAISTTQSALIRRYMLAGIRFRLSKFETPGM